MIKRHTVQCSPSKKKITESVQLATLRDPRNPRRETINFIVWTCIWGTSVVAGNVSGFPKNQGSPQLNTCMFWRCCFPDTACAFDMGCGFLCAIEPAQKRGKREGYNESLAVFYTILRNVSNCMVTFMNFFVLQQNHAHVSILNFTAAMHIL